MKPVLYSLRSKLICAILVIIAIPAVSITWFSVSSFQRQIEAKQEETLVSRLTTAALIYENQLAKLRGLAQAISMDNTTKVTLHLGVRSQLADYLSQRIDEHALTILTITDSQGIVFCRGTVADSYGEDLSTHPMVRQALAGSVVLGTEIVSAERAAEEGISAIGPAFPGGRAMMAEAASPIRMRGEVIGTLLIGIILNENDELADELAGQCGHVGVAIVQGETVIASAAIEDICVVAWQPFIRQECAIPQRCNTGRHLGASCALRAQSGDTTGRIAVVASGDDMVAAVQATRNRMLLIAAAGTVLAVMMTLLISRTIADPINRIVRAMAAFGKGDWHQTVTLNQHDEVAQLAVGFNEMASNLTLRTEELEASKEELTRHRDHLDELVRQRTEELTHTNQTLKQEVNERTLAQEKLRDSEQRLSLHFQSTPLSVIEFDTDFRITKWNRAAERVLGFTEAEAIGRHAIGFIVPKTAEAKVAVVWADLLAGKQGVHCINENIIKGGQVRLCEWYNTALMNGEGDVIGVASLMQDITERVRADEDLRQTKESAEQANISKSEFLANMSHELRTPMNGVLGMAGLLADTDLSNEQREFLRMLTNSAENLLSLLNNILDLSKIEAGQLAIEDAEFDLHQVIEDVIDAMGQQAHDKRLELVCRVRPDVPTTLWGDQYRLRQVLVNLVGNAVKFTEAGEVVMTVELAERDTKQVTLAISVRDTGIGIAPAEQEHIFDAFTQGDSSTVRQYGGTGLGLAISRRLVNAMGGELEVDSVVERGSTIRFTAVFGASASPEQADAMPDLQDLRILVVDDNQSSRQAMCDMLRACDARVEEACDAPEAMSRLHRAADDAFGVAVIDVDMPGTDGFVLVDGIRGDETIPPLKIVMLTSCGLQGDAKRAAARKLNACLTKPVRSSRLLKAISDLTPSASWQPKPARTDEEVASQVSLSGLRVLLAEDNGINRALATRLLTKRGCSVTEAVDGHDAIAALAKGRCDVVLMDVQMPGMDGLEATRQIRLDPQWRDLPIIALTAHAMKGDREACLAAGMTDYLSKPIDPKQLEQVLSRYLPSHAVSHVDGEDTARSPA